MNGKKVVIITLALFCVAFGGQLFSQEHVATMRGTTAIDETSVMPENKPWTGKTDPIARDFVEQPPLIPHKSQSYKINMEGNRCLSCHGMDTYQKKKATLVSATHYKDRDGKQLDNVSPSRYSCTLCHVEQRVAEPLVGNEYKPAQVLK